MDGRVGCGLGGIAGLVRLIRDHGEAVEYDLITIGLRLDWLGTEALSWRDLWVIVRQAPRDSAIRRAVDPKVAHTTELELLRVIEYRTHLTAWLHTEDAKHRRNQPEPIRFPWEPKGDAFGLESMDRAEMARRLGWPAPTS